MSFDSGRPINSHARYDSVPAADKEYQPTPGGQRRGSRKWLVVGVIAAIIIVGAGVGLGVGLTRHNNDNKKSGSGGSTDPAGAASSAINAKSSIGRFATATDPFYLMPDYPSTVRVFFFLFPCIKQNSIKYRHSSRLIPLHSLPQHSSTRTTSTWPGPRILSNLPTRNRPTSALTARASSHLRTSGRRFLTLLPMILTSKAGTTPSSRTPHSTSLYLPSSTISMEPVVFWITPVKLKCVLRRLRTATACRTTPNGAPVRGRSYRSVLIHRILRALLTSPYF